MEGHSNGKSIAARLKKELIEFESLFAQLEEDILNYGSKDPHVAEVMKWMKEVIEYNVPFGKKNRGIAVVTSYCQLAKNPTDEDMKRARILGWLIEIFQAFSLMVDDMLDSSITRRGRTCWYRQKNVGNRAINDTNFLEAAMYFLLKKYFRDQPYYVHLLELFHQITQYTLAGECLDLITSRPEAQIDLTNFTQNRYNAIVKWKTAYYSFYLPVAMAMYMAKISDEQSHSSAQTILLQMGHFFQVQDDYLDCYGAPEVIGKIGTDIQDNKCSWLVVQALMLASPEQKKVLEENYGIDKEENILKVKELYKDLKLEEVYKNYEEKSYQELISLIDIHSNTLPKQMFLDFANRIYKRKK